MPEVDWQAEIQTAVDRMVRERKRQRLLAKAKEFQEQQKPNKIGAAAMIREDRDAR